MNIIVAVNADWGIGHDGKQVVVLPEDRKFFREKTTGGTIITGRKTFEDFPGILPNRKNIILTRDENFSHESLIICRSVEEVLEIVKDDDPNMVFVVGGGSIYNQFLPLCSKAYITKLDIVPHSDTYFPNLDELENWSVDHEMSSGESGAVKYALYLYINNDLAQKPNDD